MLLFYYIFKKKIFFYIFFNFIPLLSLFYMFIFYYFYCSRPLSFIRFMFYYVYYLIVLSLNIVSLNYHYLFLSLSFIILKFIFILFIIFIPLIIFVILLMLLMLLVLIVLILILINIKQDVLDGRPLAGIEPGTFSPAFSAEPGRRTTPRPPNKTLRLGQFQERSPQRAENCRKIVQSGERKTAGIFCKNWANIKPMFQQIPGILSGPAPKFPKVWKKMDSSKKPKIPGILAATGEGAKDVFLTSP